MLMAHATDFHFTFSQMDQSVKRQTNNDFERCFQLQSRLDSSQYRDAQKSIEWIFQIEIIHCHQ